MGLISLLPKIMGGLPSWYSGKESICSAGSARDACLIPRSGRSPGVGNGNLLWYSCLEDSMDREEPGGLQFMELQRIGCD